MRDKWCELMFAGMLFDHADLSYPVGIKFKGKIYEFFTALVFCWTRSMNR